MHNETSEKMTIIITMAGIGKRFRDAGYKIPKYQIIAKGKTLFEWAMDSLEDYKEHTEKVIFVVREGDNARDFIYKKCEKYNYNEIFVLELDAATDGQATTALRALEYSALELPILIYNIDTYIEPYTLRYGDLCGDGHIPCFCAEGTHWSFVKTDDKNHVIEVREKERISSNCSVGAYYFSSGLLYEKMYRDYYLKINVNEKREKYIAPIYNYMISLGMDVTMSILDINKIHVLGTPQELDAFLREQ